MPKNEPTPVPVESVTVLPVFKGRTITEARLAHDGYDGWLELDIDGWGTYRVSATNSDDDAQPLFAPLDGTRVSVVDVTPIDNPTEA